MICPDCEFEVDKLTKNGICKRCSQRRSDCKYKGKEYVKIKDIKDTPTYKRILANIEYKEKMKNTVQISKNDVIDLKQSAKDIVEKDIEDRINKLNLNKDILSLPLEFVLESFVKIFNKDILREKNSLKNEYEVFITDRLHRLLYTDDLNEIQNIALEQKYIEEEIEDDLDTFHWFDDTPNNLTRKQIKECIDAHQGLLDLYNKEKEKNTELRIKISARETVVEELQKQIEEYKIILKRQEQ